MGVKEHKKGIKQEFKCAILTISTSRYEGKGKDDSGNLMKRILEENDHEIMAYEIIPDDMMKIKEKIVRLMEEDVDFIITSGGTGLTKNDVTIEAIIPLIEKDMPGFGEIFRRMSYDRIGGSAILTRSLAGKIGEKAIFCLPGSPDAVELALNIIIPEIPHIMRHIKE
jgi:molybdenum cofactor biosynthesis protein B